MQARSPPSWNALLPASAIHFCHVFGTLALGMLADTWGKRRWGRRFGFLSLAISDAKDRTVTNNLCQDTALESLQFVRVSPGLWSGCASLGIQNQGLQTGSALESMSSKPQVSLSQLLLFRAGHGFFAGTATWLHKLIKTAWVHWSWSFFCLVCVVHFLGNEFFIWPKKMLLLRWAFVKPLLRMWLRQRQRVLLHLQSLIRFKDCILYAYI